MISIICIIRLRQEGSRVRKEGSRVQQEISEEGRRAHWPKRVYLIIMETVCFSVCNRNYSTTQVTIPFVIFVTLSMILFLFKPQLLIKLFYIIYTVGHIF